MRSAICILICLLSICMSCQQKSAAKCSVLLQTIDAQIGRPLPIQVTGPSISKEDRWELSFTAIRESESQMKLSWRAIKALPVKMASSGYQQKSLLLDENAPALLIVGLVKAGAWSRPAQ